MKRSDNVKTGITVALSSGDDRAMLTYNGTIDTVGREAISDELLESVRHLHIGSYFLMKKIQPHYPEILKKLKANGASISLDTNWDPEEKWDSGIRDVLKYVDVILPNEKEAMALMRENSPEKAIDKLRKIVKTVAVKRGKEGAAVYTEGSMFDIPSIDVPKVDAVGAGDSFDGGFVYGLLTGFEMKKCAQAGCICGSLNTRAAGGTAGQPKLEEMVAYFEKL
jgi:sugar/nucleoside kinase (ribokinase family)